MVRELATPEQLEQVRQRIPLQRYGTPEDEARLVAFLCSEEASYITGTELVVDGGWLAV